MKLAIHLSVLALVICVVLPACTVAKLEARLEADPQCRPIINPKTGALMPCPGSDKAFYLAAGLGPVKTDGSSPSAEVASKGTPLNSAGAIMNTNQSTRISTSVDCKPKIHQKTGGVLPCPSE